MEKLNCKENFMGMIKSIKAVPNESVDFYIPLDFPSKVIEASSFSYNNEGFELITKKKSIKVSESRTSSISGDAYNVKISWEVEVPDYETSKEIDLQLRLLSENVYHLLIKSVDGQGYWLRVTKGAYTFEYIEKGGIYACEFNAHSVAGIQRIP